MVDNARNDEVAPQLSPACPEPDTSPYFRFSQEYGFVSTNIGTMTPLISHSDWFPEPWEYRVSAT